MFGKNKYSALVLMTGLLCGSILFLGNTNTAYSQSVGFGFYYHNGPFTIGIGTGIYDRYGYDCYGYDRYGYDRHGYNRYGYNRFGYNRYGYDRYGHSKYHRVKFVRAKRYVHMYKVKRYRR
jgi:hypothetical protein